MSSDFVGLKGNVHNFTGWFSMACASGATQKNPTVDRIVPVIVNRNIWKSLKWGASGAP
jgi:hypothetical protein